MKGLLLVTCAGESTRFGAWGPKWRLTHPNGRMMALEAVSSMIVDRDVWDVAFVVRHAADVEILERALVRSAFPKARVVRAVSTKTRADTVKSALSALEWPHSWPVCVRDCDNALRVTLDAEICGKSFVALGDMLDCGTLDPSSRSYAELSGDRVASLVERGIVTRWFCAGVYGFARASMLCAEGFEHMTQALQHAISFGEAVLPLTVTDYKDWGTAEEWKRFRAAYKTLFVDIDGTLFYGGHEFIAPVWGDNPPMVENVRALRAAYDSGTTCVVLTTSRPETYRRKTLEQLHRHEVRFHHLLMGLPTGGRVLINDAVPDRCETTAHAVQVDRNEDGQLHAELVALGVLK